MKYFTIFCAPCGEGHSLRQGEVELVCKVVSVAACAKCKAVIGENYARDYRVFMRPIRPVMRERLKAELVTDFLEMLPPMVPPKVTCDESNNTPESLVRGELHIHIGP